MRFEFSVASKRRRSSATTRFVATLLFTCVLGVAVEARATDVAEGADFSNLFPGSAYALTPGTNTFSGGVSTPNDGQDNFQVTIPEGHQLVAVSKNVSGGSFSGFVTFNLNESLMGGGAGSFTQGLPLGPGTYSATVAANFSTGSSWSMTFTVESIGNAAPTNISLSQNTVLENEPAGTTVGTFSTTDSNPLDTFTYALVSGTGSGDNGAFTIVGSSLRTSAAFDYETKTSYSIRVRSTDPGGLSYERSFSIQVVNVNDNLPVITAGQTREIDEGAANGTNVGAPIAAADGDVGATLSGWQITGGNTGGAFSIDASTGQLRVADSAALDPAVTPSFTLTVTVSDGVFTSSDTTVIVDVIADCAPLAVSPDQLGSVRIGEALTSTTMMVDGEVGEVSWSISGELPEGVTFEEGTFTGTPAEAGEFVVEITAIDSLGCSGSTSVGLIVTCGAIVGDARTVCGAQATAALGGSLPSDAVSGQWSDGGAGGSFSPDAAAPDATYTPPAGFAGELALTFTVTGAGCEAEAPLGLTVTVLDPSAGECCVEASDCDDGDVCSLDDCVAEVCTHAPNPDCSSDGGVTEDGGIEPDGGAEPIAPEPSGCGCSADGEPPSAAPLALVLLLGLGYVGLRRRLYP